MINDLATILFCGVIIINALCEAGVLKERLND